MADNNSANDDKAGNYSDNLLRLVEETDKDGNISYCVECVKTGDLLYSSNSKPQAFSYCEGYRAANGEGGSKPRMPKDNSDKRDNGDNSDKSATPPAIDPSTVKRKRMVF